MNSRASKNGRKKELWIQGLNSSQIGICTNFYFKDIIEWLKWFEHLHFIQESKSELTNQPLLASLPTSTLKKINSTRHLTQLKQKPSCLMKNNNGSKKVGAHARRDILSEMLVTYIQGICMVVPVKCKCFLFMYQQVASFNLPSIGTTQAYLAWGHGPCLLQ